MSIPTPRLQSVAIQIFLNQSSHLMAQHRLTQRVIQFLHGGILILMVT